MDWLGIGVLIIGIALLILTFVLIKPILKLATVLDSLKKTTDKLPTIVDENANEANTALKNVNLTLENVNNQVSSVTPLFQIVEDAGNASRQVSLKWLSQANNFKEDSLQAQAFTEKQKYEGLYGVLSFLFYLFRQKDEIAKETEVIKDKFQS